MNGYFHFHRLRMLSVALLFSGFAAAGLAATPAVIRESETGARTHHGTWTWDDKRQVYVAKWDNGAEATLTVVEKKGGGVEFIRTDTNAAFTARYTGTRTGNKLTGAVEWTSGGKSWRGTWEGTEEAAKPFGAVLTSAEVNDLFKRMAGQKDIAFQYPDDGCNARAYLMAKRMAELGGEPGKVWAFARNGHSLEVDTPNHPSGRVQWDYHVAPTVRVKLKDGERDMVIDPSLFDRPVTVEHWRDAIRSTDGKRTYVTQTRIGEPPTDAAGVRRNGTGYAPGKEPADLDAAARVRMQKMFALLNERTGKR